MVIQQQQAIQVEGTEKIVLQKNGYAFEFTEGMFNGYPDMKVTMNAHTSSIRGMNDEKIVFQFSIEKVGGISSQGVEKALYQKIKEMYQNIKNKADEMKKKEEDEKYAPLYAEMKKIAMPKNNENPDDEKCKELLKTAQANSFYNEDPEYSGLNLASASYCVGIYREAGKLCNHNFKINFDRTYTEDARLKLVREVSCEKCHFSHKDTVETHTNNGWI